MQFSNLPNNVIPTNIILANEQTCYVNVDFKCDDGKVCTLYSINLLLINPIKHICFIGFIFSGILSLSFLHYYCNAFNKLL